MTAISTEKLYTDLREQLKIFILSKVHNKELAEDILHDTFVKVHSKLDSLKDNEKIVSWVYQIARNAIIDYYRKQNPAVLGNPLPGGVAAEADGVGMSQRLQLALKNMIECLPSEHRDALFMTEYEGLTQKELAVKLHISVPGAKSRVQRARKKLKEMLFDCCHFEFDKFGTVMDYYPKNKSCSCCKT